MSTIAKGHDFNTGDDATAANINSMVDDATIADILRSELDSDATKVTFIGASSPSGPEEHDTWYDTGRSFLLKYTGSAWDLVGRGFLSTNAMGVTMDQGTVVKPVNTLEVTATEPGDHNTVGVAAEHIAPGGTGLIQTFGTASVRYSATATLGEILIPSTTATGEAEAFEIPSFDAFAQIGWVGQTVTNPSVLGTAFLKRAF